MLLFSEENSCIEFSKLIQVCSLWIYTCLTLFPDVIFFHIKTTVVDIVYTYMVFPGGSMVKNLPANAEDLGSIPGLGRSPGEGNGNPLQCSCLENPRDGGAWWAAVYGVAQSQTRLKWQQQTSCSAGKTPLFWCLQQKVPPPVGLPVVVCSALVLLSLWAYAQPFCCLSIAQ